jgi:hypothetical protein
MALLHYIQATMTCRSCLRAGERLPPRESWPSCLYILPQREAKTKLVCVWACALAFCQCYKESTPSMAGQQTAAEVYAAQEA